MGGAFWLKKIHAVLKLSVSSNNGPNHFKNQLQRFNDFFSLVKVLNSTKNETYFFYVYFGDQFLRIICNKLNWQVKKFFTDFMRNLMNVIPFLKNLIFECFKVVCVGKSTIHCQSLKNEYNYR